MLGLMMMERKRERPLTARTGEAFGTWASFFSCRFREQMPRKHFLYLHRASRSIKAVPAHDSA